MSPSKVRIISIDGGGVGGVIPAVMLARLEAARPGLLANTDMFAGTSTGGILALALAAGKRVTRLADFYRTDCPKIFARSWWRVISSLGGLRYSRFDNAVLRKTFEREFNEDERPEDGGVKAKPFLGQLDKPVFVASGSLVQDDARKFCTWPNPRTSPDAKVRCIDGAGATSAASSVFDPWDVLGEGLHVDGGETGLNCPAASATARVYRHPASRNSEIVVLSLGCGDRKSVQRGYGWLGAMAGRIIGWLLKWSVKTTVEMCDLFLGETFHRLDPKLTADYDAFDPAEVAGLEAQAQAWPIDDSLQFIDDHWDLPTAAAPVK